MVDAVLRPRVRVGGRAPAPAGHARRARVRQPRPARAAAVRPRVHALDAAQLGRLPRDVGRCGARSRSAQARCPPPAGGASAVRAVRPRAVRSRGGAGEARARSRRRGRAVLRLRPPLQGARYAARGLAGGARAAPGGGAGRGRRVLRGCGPVSGAGGAGGRTAARPAAGALPARRGSGGRVQGRGRGGAAVSHGDAERRHARGVRARRARDHDRCRGAPRNGGGRRDRTGRSAREPARDRRCDRALLRPGPVALAARRGGARTP